MAIAAICCPRGTAECQLDSDYLGRVMFCFVFSVCPLLGKCERLQGGDRPWHPHLWFEVLACLDLFDAGVIAET